MSRQKVYGDPGDAFPWKATRGNCHGGSVNRDPGDHWPWSASQGGDGVFPLASTSDDFTRQLGTGEYSAGRIGSNLFVRAKTTFPVWNADGAIVQSPKRIYPPQFEFYVYIPKVGQTLIREATITERFGFPEAPTHVKIMDATGLKTVRIESLWPNMDQELARDANHAQTGVGFDITHEGAIDSAIEQIEGTRDAPPEPPGRYVVLETGKLKGGAAQLNLFFAKVALQA